jgi:transposase
MEAVIRPHDQPGSHRMREADEQGSHVFRSLSADQRVRADHPLRGIRRIADRVLAELAPRLPPIHLGAPSIPPEQLLRALLIQELYAIPTEELLTEEIDYSVLHRWFVGLGTDEPIWSSATFRRNQEQLFEGDAAATFLESVIDQAREAGLLSNERFTVDGARRKALYRNGHAARRSKPRKKRHDSVERSS